MRTILLWICAIYLWFTVTAHHFRCPYSISRVYHSTVLNSISTTLPKPWSRIPSSYLSPQRLRCLDFGGFGASIALNYFCSRAYGKHGQDSEKVGRVSSKKFTQECWNQMEEQSNQRKITELDRTEATTRHRRREEISVFGTRTPSPLRNGLDTTWW